MNENEFSPVVRASLILKNTDSNEWKELNPILLKGELGIENDTKLIKVGDGINHYNDLNYINSSQIIMKNGSEETWNLVEDFIPRQGEIIIYNADNLYPKPRIKIGNGVDLPRNLPFIMSSEGSIDLDNIIANRVKGKLTFGSDGAFVYDGSTDINVPVYTGKIS